MKGLACQREQQAAYTGVRAWDLAVPRMGRKLRRFPVPIASSVSSLAKTVSAS